jgi:hypothetical protein
MRIRGLTLSLLFFLFIILNLLISCTPAACLGETTSLLNAAIYQTGTNKPFKPDSITIYGIGKPNEKLYSKAANITMIKFQLDASSKACGFVVKVNKVVDTLWFRYTSRPYLISKECGFTFFFTLDSCIWRGSVIDTINIRNNQVAIFNEENIRIFF